MNGSHLQIPGRRHLHCTHPLSRRLFVSARKILNNCPSPSWPPCAYNERSVQTDLLPPSISIVNILEAS